MASVKAKFWKQLGKIIFFERHVKPGSGLSSYRKWSIQYNGGGGGERVKDPNETSNLKPEPKVECGSGFGEILKLSLTPAPTPTNNIFRALENDSCWAPTAAPVHLKNSLL